jgi:hypothetical protein
MFGAIDKLVGDEEFARSQFFLEGAHGADGDDAVHAEKFERVNVGAVIDFGRQNAMAAAVAGKEGDAFALEKPVTMASEGSPKGVLTRDFPAIGEAFHRIKAAAPMMPMLA